MFKRIVISSIYNNSDGQRIVLPKRMALLEEEAADALDALSYHMEAINVTLHLSDAYRSREAQAEARHDFTSGKKRAYSPPPGESIHEAGRAIDVDLDMGIPLSRFWEIAALYGWHPIISVSDSSSLEAWHFEYLAYWRTKPNDILSFRRCAVLEAYIENDVHTLSATELCFLLQGYLKIMGLYTLRVDGLFGPGTRSAIKKYSDLYARDITAVTSDITALGLEVRQRWHYHTLRLEGENHGC